MPLSSEDRAKIAKALLDHGAGLPCPRCANNSWNIVDGYINHPISDIVGQLILGGPVLPTIVVVCTKCGFLAEHAAGVLGLMPSADIAPAQRVEESNNSIGSQAATGEK